MSSLKDMFLVSFSIIYGIMLNSCMGLGLFYFGHLKDENNIIRYNVLYRIILSFILINIFPFLYFIGIFESLNNLTITPVKTLGVFLLSIGVYIFYRALHYIFKKYQNIFYGTEVDCQLKKRLDQIGPYIEGQIWGVFFYFFIILLGLILIFFMTFIDELIILYSTNYFQLYLIGFSSVSFAFGLYLDMLMKR